MMPRDVILQQGLSVQTAPFSISAAIVYDACMEMHGTVSQAIIACEMMKDEIQRALAESGNTSRVIWLESGLHEHPESLREALQSAINEAPETEILLAFGLCGNALHGIVSPHARLVIPRYHDCIHMMLVTEDQPDPATAPDTLYYTNGWFATDLCLIKQYERFAAKRGEKKALTAYRLMTRNYRSVSLIDTGTGHLDQTVQLANKTADLLGLTCECIPGSIDVLVALFSRKWDEHFVIVEAGHALSQNDFINL